MTTVLEKQFFDTFGIEPKPLFSTRNGYTNDVYCYPEITSDILLELICILTQDHEDCSENWLRECNNVEDLKTSILKILLLRSIVVKQQVQDYLRSKDNEK